MAVPEYELVMDAADLKWLRSHVGTPRCFEAELRTDAGVRPTWIGYRGRYSRWFRKPSFDVWFADGGPAAPQRKLHLNAAYRDPSMLRGRLSLELFGDMGVPVPRAWHVSLSVNGRPHGLYTALESLDDGWLAQRGETGAGIYYAVGTDGTFGLVDPETGEQKRYLASGYEKVWPHEDDFTDLERLIYQITLPTDAEFETQIDDVIDVECFLRWLIGVEFMSHTDGLVQNYALFRSEGGRWQISPWDCDGTWGRVPNGNPIEADYMAMGTGDDNYLAIRLLRAPRWRQRYRALWTELLDGPLSRRNVGDRLEAIYQEIREDALQDEEKRWSNSTFLREPRKIRKFHAERLAVAQGLLQELVRKGPPG